MKVFTYTIYTCTLVCVRGCMCDLIMCTSCLLIACNVNTVSSPDLYAT